MTAAFLQRRPAMPLIIAVAVLGGWAFGLLQETQDQGLVYWWSFVVLAMALGAAACLLPVGRDPRFVLALRAVPPLIAAVLALALGDFSAYLLHIGGRNLDNYSLTM